LGIVISLLALLVSGFGQAAGALTFEVASIKPAEQITPAMIQAGKIHIGLNVDAARVDIGYLSLADLIPIAFKVKPYQVSGPDWMNVQRFDILAKLPEGATKEQMPEMLQALLVERFQLKVHHETRDQNVYGLVANKGALKIKESEPDSSTPPGEGQRGGATISLGNGSQVRVDQGRGATISTPENGTMKVTPGPDGAMHMEMSKMSMAQFSETLARFVDRPVIDMTELKGNYQVALDLPMDVLLNMARAAGVGIPNIGALGGRGEPGRVDASDPSSGAIFRSVQQLGLRLEPRKSPMDLIVVDHVEKMPSEN